MSTNPRDFFLARLASARSSAQSAVDAIDAVLEFMNNPVEDKNGKQRTLALEGADAMLGHAASSVQLAMEAFDDVDLAEQEPEEYDDEEDGDEEDDDEEEEEEEEEEGGDPGDEQPPKRARRRR